MYKFDRLFLFPPFSFSPLPLLAKSYLGCSERTPHALAHRCFLFLPPRCVRPRSLDPFEGGNQAGSKPGEGERRKEGRKGERRKGLFHRRQISPDDPSHSDAPQRTSNSEAPVLWNRCNFATVEHLLSDCAHLRQESEPVQVMQCAKRKVPFGVSKRRRVIY